MGAHMNLEKYIELLRFYVTEKIDEVNSSLQKSLDDVIGNIFSSIIASILALLISTECIQSQGVEWVIIRTVLLIIVFSVAFFVVRFIRRKYMIKKQLKAAKDKQITPAEAKRWITDFDHIACDSILLAWDFLKKFKSKKTSENEEVFCLIEAIYYYKKAVSIISIIVQKHESCVNSINLAEGIAPYRIKNASASLEDIKNKIEEVFSVLGISNQDEIALDVSGMENDLKSIIKYSNTLP